MPTSAAASGEAAADDDVEMIGADAAARTPDMATSGSSRMKKHCDHCKRHMDHTDEKNPSMGCFLRHMTSSLKHIMIMPNRFLKHFVGKLSQTIKLESPNGSVYNVEATERYKKMVLGHGWEEFVSDYHIEENDFLLFQHIENSIFKVLIFDSDGCQKIICCDGMKSIPSVGETRVDYVDIPSSSQFDTIGSPGKLSSRHGETLKMTVTSSSSGGSGYTAKKAGTSSLYEESGEDSLSCDESIQSDNVKAFSERNYVLSARCDLTAEQEEKIVALVKKIQPEIPVLVVLMRKSYLKLLRSELVIYKGYAAQHFPQKSQYVTLECRGKKWRPKFHIRPDGRGYILSMRWQDFALDNSLREDDICLFQPMPSDKGFRVMVHLLCEPSTRSSSSDGHVHMKRGVTSTAHVHEKSGSENSGSLDLRKLQAAQQGHKVLSDCGGPSSSKPPLYVVLDGTCLTTAQDKAVREKAMAIKAEVSIFVATMNKKILGYNKEAVIILDISDAADYLPDGKQALTLRQQGQGRAWCTNLHNRLLLATGEWRQFAHDSGLEDGDICLFEPIKNKRLAMLVHIIRSKQYS